MKTFNKKDVFTLVTAEEAKAYISKRGYFGDSFEELESDIKSGYSEKLKEVFPDRYTSIVFRPYASDTSYGLFIPVDKIKEVEEPKKYRPFETIEEFVKTIGYIGTIITYRTKKDPAQEMIGIFTGYMWDSACRGWILGIGASLYRLENLFELAEYKHKNEWKPFGVLDE